MIVFLAILAIIVIYSNYSSRNIYSNTMMSSVSAGSELPSSMPVPVFRGVSTGAEHSEARRLRFRHLSPVHELQRACAQGVVNAADSPIPSS